MLKWPALPAGVPALSVRTVLPGASLLLVGALALYAVDSAVSNLPTPLLAVLLGIAAGRLVRTSSLAPSARLVGRWFLRMGIVLLGLRFSIEQLQDLGLEVFSLIVPAIAVGFTVAYVLGRWQGLPPRLSLLLATGTAICGNSAIVAAAPALGAEEDEVAVSVAAITIYGTIALLLFPLVGAVLGMEQDTFGRWAGTAINDTSQVIGAGFAFGEVAGERATVVKLARNLFMIPVILGLSVVGARWRREGAGPGGVSRFGSAFPLFVLGFVGLAVVNSVFDVPMAVRDVGRTASTVLILGALIGVGVGASRVPFARAKGRPLWTGVLAGLALAVVTLGFLLLGIGR